MDWLERVEQKLIRFMFQALNATTTRKHLGGALQLPPPRWRHPALLPFADHSGKTADMLANLKTHWLSTASGILGASLGAFAATANLDTLSAGQAALAYAGCLWVAVQGFLTADARKVPPQQ